VSGPQHFASHRSLLTPFKPGRARLGGIVTPVTRDADKVLPNIELGATLGVPVVVLCSKGAKPEEIAQRAVRTGADCAIVDLDQPYRTDLLPSFRTDEFADAIAGAYGDLSLKRNLGLLLGRLAGWPTLLFLDDDLFDVNPSDVRRAVGALQHHTAVGMPAKDFPDNSVVCHARRFTTGVQQDVFVSGSALAVNVLAADSFFPHVYNEDWLFLAPHLQGRAVAERGEVRQRFFNPFDSPQRAVRQEFGDVLAEGLVGHLHGDHPDGPPTKTYWRDFLKRRAELIAAAAAGCRSRTRVNPYARDALRSLEQSEATLARITPTLLDEYVEAWRLDLDAWREHLVGIECTGSLDAALETLDVRSSRVSPRQEVRAPTSPI
jgi:hypothetical protein